MSDARTVIAEMLCALQDVKAGYLSKTCSEHYNGADAILAALAEAGLVLMEKDAVTKHKAWCPAMSQCECEGSE